jgi:hypothetical protein
VLNILSEMRGKLRCRMDDRREFGLMVSFAEVGLKVSKGSTLSIPLRALVNCFVAWSPAALSGASVTLRSRPS